MQIWINFMILLYKLVVIIYRRKIFIALFSFEIVFNKNDSSRLNQE